MSSRAGLQGRCMLLRAEFLPSLLLVLLGWKFTRGQFGLLELQLAPAMLRWLVVAADAAGHRDYVFQVTRHRLSC